MNSVLLLGLFVGGAVGAAVGFVIAVLVLLISPDISGWFIVWVFVLSIGCGAGFYGAMSDR